MVPFAKFVERLAEARESGEFCDFELRCEKFTIKVHKVVLASRSAVLGKACSGSFKESEAGFYDVKDTSPTALKCMVTYMYTEKYDISCPKGHETDLLVTHAQVFLLADKYFITELQDFAKSKFEECVQSLADSSALLNAVPKVYLSAGGVCQQLRDVMVDSAKAQMNKFTFTADMERLLGDVTTKAPEFLQDFFKSAWIEPIHRTRYCENCRRNVLVTGERLICPKCCTPVSL